MRAVDGFRQPEPRHARRDQRDERRRPDRRRITDLHQDAAQGRPQDEPEAKRRADQPVRARAVLRLRDIGDVGARGRDVAARQAVDDARQKQHRHAVSEREHRKADDRAGQAEDQHRPPAVAVRQLAERRRGGELADREHREQQTDHDRRGAEGFRVERQQRDDDPEADQVDEDGEENDEERAGHRMSAFYNETRTSLTQPVRGVNNQRA